MLLNLQPWVKRCCIALDAWLCLQKKLEGQLSDQMRHIAKLQDQLSRAGDKVGGPGVHEDCLKYLYCCQVAFFCR
jgi:hypothetical protein